MLIVEFPLLINVQLPVPVPGSETFFLNYAFWLALPIPIPGTGPAGVPVWVHIPLPEPHLEVAAELTGVYGYDAGLYGAAGA